MAYATQCNLPVSRKGETGLCTPTEFGVLDFQVEVYARAGFPLLCITTFVPRTIEILRVHTLTLLLENLKLQSMPQRLPKSHPSLFNDFMSIDII